MSEQAARQGGFAWGVLEKRASLSFRLVSGSVWAKYKGEHQAFVAEAARWVTLTQVKVNIQAHVYEHGTNKIESRGILTSYSHFYETTYTYKEKIWNKINEKAWTMVELNNLLWDEWGELSEHSG